LLYAVTINYEISLKSLCPESPVTLNLSVNTERLIGVKSVGFFNTVTDAAHP
jgi:hypothetical protein